MEKKKGQTISLFYRYFNVFQFFDKPWDFYHFERGISLTFLHRNRSQKKVNEKCFASA